MRTSYDLGPVAHAWALGLLAEAQSKGLRPVPTRRYAALRLRRELTAEELREGYAWARRTGSASAGPLRRALRTY